MARFKQGLDSPENLASRRNVIHLDFMSWGWALQRAHGCHFVMAGANPKQVSEIIAFSVFDFGLPLLHCVFWCESQLSGA